jgi:NACalpha-BTF3-like transcription factor
MDEPDKDPIGLLLFIAEREGAIARIETELYQEQERLRTCELAIEDLKAAIPQGRNLLINQEEILRSLKEAQDRNKGLGVSASSINRGMSRSNARDKLRAYIAAPSNSADIEMMEKQVVIQARKVWDIRNSIRESEMELGKWKQLYKLSASLVERLSPLKQIEEYSHQRSRSILRNYIENVPTTVWKRVFEFVLADPSTDPKAARMGQVCNLWRQIMKGHPRLLIEEKVWLTARQKMARAASRRDGGAPSNAGAGLSGGTSAMAKLGEQVEDDDVLFDLESLVDEERKVDEEDGEISEGDIDPEVIEVVMNQADCSRKKAVKALKDSGGDIINASTSISSISRI